MSRKPSAILWPSEVSSRVGFFDRFAGMAARLASEYPESDLDNDMLELRAAIGLEAKESTSGNAK